MKKILLLCLTTMLTFTGGCGMSKEKDNGKVEQQSMPETEAFKDEFTREFMKSTEETEDGFYTFESKTKAYTMLFPKNALVSEMDYQANGHSFEAFSIGEDKEEENLSYYIKVIFEDKKTTKNITAKLNVLSDMAGYTGEYSKEAGKEFDVYYATKEEMSYGKNVVTHLAYIKDKETNKAISFNFNGGCTNPKEACSLTSKEKFREFNEIIQSVKFAE